MAGCHGQSRRDSPREILPELKTLPLDFVLARDHIFSAKEAALPILALFLGESEGNENERLCDCTLC
jgi:hypothetical protein